MISEKEVLLHIGETADMGRDSIACALKHAHDPSLRQMLQRQMQTYDRFFSRADAALRARGHDPIVAPKMARAGARMMVQMQTAMAPDTDAKILQLVIEGSAKGVAKITETLRKYDGEDTEVLDLARDLTRAEEENIRALARDMASA